MKNPRIPIGAKIIGLAISLLGLLVAVAYTSQQRIRMVQSEVEDLVGDIVPINGSVGRVNVHTLEQELHFERIIGEHESGAMNRAVIEAERARFEARTALVEVELDGAIARARSFEAKTSTLVDQEVLSRLAPTLERIRQEHREYHRVAIDTFRRLEAGERGRTVREMEDRVDAAEDDLQRTLDALVDDVISHTDRAARSSERHQMTLGRNLILFTLAAVALGLVGAVVFTSGIVRPVGQLLQQIQTMEHGDSGDAVEVRSRDEVGLLADAFNLMFRGLEEKKRLKAIFGQYVDRRVVERLEDGGRSLPTDGEKRIATVLMADVANFTAATTELPPEQTLDVINRYLDLLTPSILDRQGFVEFVGTAIKGFWTSPFVVESEHALLAAEAALEQISRLKSAHGILGKLPGTNVGPNRWRFEIGLATGPLVLGNIGPRGAMAYTVLGDTVNTAARIRGVANQYGVEILMPEETARHIGTRMATRELGQVQVVGKEDTLRVFELLGHAGALDPTLSQLTETYALGLRAYRDRSWEQASRNFEACLRIKADDGPSKRHLEWISDLTARELPDDWDGVWRLNKK